MNKIKINRTAVYQTIGNVKASEIWILLHGYGQLVRYFARKFESLNLENKLLIFPQGMHRYYLKGSGGRVGASWMTKEDREDDIADNHLFLDQLLAQYRHEEVKKVVVFGFSQGAATAARWAAETSNEINAIALWGAVFPPDMNHEEWQNKQLPSFLIHGNKDPYLQNKDQHDFKLLTELNGVDLIHYQGGHDIDDKALIELEKKIKEI